jgi:ABC-type ATPase with predicted acetyltransferase domain
VRIEEGKIKRLAEHPIARYFVEGQRVQITSERVDDLPLLLTQLKEVRVPELPNE